MARRWVVAATGVVWLAAATMLAPAAAAAPETGWAQWTAIAGGSHAFRGSMQLPPAGFPAASWTSNSRSPVQLPGGASTALGAATPPGARYGSSQGNSYLNLRPYADNATSPSTTTFDFADATPSAGWTFVLGDIDADQVRIDARDATGQPVPNSDIDHWERGAFNYAGGTDKPAWQPASATLVGNATAADTNGASDWFEPDRALSSLTFVFTQRAGFPVFQVWLAALARDVSGSVTGTAQCPSTTSTVRLLGPDGKELADTHPGPDGRYAFAGYTAQPGYTVAIDAPATPVRACAIDGARTRRVDLSDANAVADFAVRDVIPEPVGGIVTTADGTPVAGVTVTLTPPVGPAKTTTTDDTGQYLLDGNAAGTGYRVTVTAPDGYATSPPAQRTFDVAAATPVPEQNFELVEQPAVTGTVTGPDGPLGSVPITLLFEDGRKSHTVTDADGHYRFDRVAPGTYAISVSPPDGFASPLIREGVEVRATDVTGQDFTLVRAGSIAGTVSAGGRPVGDVAVTVAGPAGNHTTRTSTGGTFAFSELAAGRYRVIVSPPGGFRVGGSRTVTITAAGELRGGVDFALVRVVASSPAPPSPTPSAPPAPAAPASDGSLAATGAAPMPLVLIAVGLLVSGAGVLVAGRRTRVDRSVRRATAP